MAILKLNVKSDRKEYKVEISKCWQCGKVICECQEIDNLFKMNIPHGYNSDGEVDPFN